MELLQAIEKTIEHMPLEIVRQDNKYVWLEHQGRAIYKIKIDSEGRVYIEYYSRYNQPAIIHLFESIITKH